MHLFTQKQQTNGSKYPDVDNFVDKDSVLIGEEDSGKQKRLPFDDWYTHIHAPGAPGTGKTAFLESLCRQLIVLKKGLTVIDPLGVLIFRLLIWLSWNPQYAERVVLVSPYTRPHYCGYNPLRKVSYFEDTNVHSAWWADLTKKAAKDDANLPLYTRLVEESADPLIEAQPSSLTPIEIPFFYTPARFPALRNIVKYSSGDGVREQWEQLLNATPAQQRKLVVEEMGSLRNRMPRFVRNHFVRMTLGRNENTLDFKDVVEDSTVLLVDTSPHSGILARVHSFTLSAVFLGAETAYMRTRSQAQAETNPRWTVIDEFQNVISPEIASSLDELRNFGWRSVLSHQRFGQLLREDRDILDAVNVDAGIKAVFGRLSPDALRILEPLVYLGEHDFYKEKYSTYANQEAVPHYFSLDELTYQRQVELYRQPRQHMTWKVLDQAPSRIKIAHVQPYEYDHERFRALIDFIIRNHPEYYLLEDDIQEIIVRRQHALEELPKDEQETLEDFRNKGR